MAEAYSVVLTFSHKHIKEKCTGRTICTEHPRKAGRRPYTSATGKKPSTELGTTTGGKRRERKRRKRSQDRTSPLKGELRRKGTLKVSDTSAARGQQVAFGGSALPCRGACPHTPRGGGHAHPRRRRRLRGLPQPPTAHPRGTPAWEPKARRPPSPWGWPPSGQPESSPRNCPPELEAQCPAPTQVSQAVVSWGGGGC